MEEERWQSLRCRAWLLTFASPLNRDTDQVHPRAVRHGPRGAAHTS